MHFKVSIWLICIYRLNDKLKGGLDNKLKEFRF